MRDTNQFKGLDLPVVYEIKVQGRLDERWSGWFSGLTVASEQCADGATITTLTGAVADQAALRGILFRIWDLSLTVIAVNRVKAGQVEIRLDRKE